MQDIRDFRINNNGNDEKTKSFVGSTVFVIDSLKNPNEIKALDSVYARNYYTISVYAPEHTGLNRLAGKIAAQLHEVLAEKHLKRASKVLRLDEGQKPADLSQDVLGAFPRADFFVRTDDDLPRQIKRFAELIFGNPFITPTTDEHFMHLAKTASLRSCDLSRQVGAVIVDNRGAVISQGCNEVTYPGGGIYFEGRPMASDNRDYTADKDPNQAGILDLVIDFVNSLRSAELLKENELTDADYGFKLMYGE